MASQEPNIFFAFRLNKCHKGDRFMVAGNSNLAAALMNIVNVNPGVTRTRMDWGWRNRKMNGRMIEGFIHYASSKMGKSDGLLDG
jgi:hypothetical protein